MNLLVCKHKKFVIRKSTLLAWVVAVLFLAISNVAKADLFDYTVHVKDNNVSDYNQARAQAMQNNRVLALRRVVDRLISLSDFVVVQKLLDADTAYFFEDKMQINNESLENNTYNVDITYYFDQTKIIAFLNKNNIPYTLNLQNKVLFIPITGNKIDPKSDWVALWLKQQQGDYLTQFVLPKDLSKLDAAKILQHNLDYLNQLQATYNVEDVILAYLNTSVVQPNPTNPAPQTTTTSSTGSATSTGPKGANQTVPPAPVTNYDLKVVSLNTTTEQSFTALSSMYDALANTFGFAENAKKADIFVSLKEKNTAIFKVTFKSFVEWVAIYNALHQMEQIENVYLSEIAPDYVVIKIKFHGSMDDIINSAKVRNILIDPADLLIKCNGLCY